MRYKLSGIIVEENLSIPPFDIDHPFEKLRDSYEKEALLNDSHGLVTIVKPDHLKV